MKTEDLKLYFWSLNSGGTGFIMSVAVIATTENEARGKVLTQKNMDDRVVEMVRFTYPAVKNIDSAAYSMWDFTHKGADK